MRPRHPVISSIINYFTFNVAMNAHCAFVSTFWTHESLQVVISSVHFMFFFCIFLCKIEAKKKIRAEKSLMNILLLQLFYDSKYHFLFSRTFVLVQSNFTHSRAIINQFFSLCIIIAGVNIILTCFMSENEVNLLSLIFVFCGEFVERR